MTSIAKIIPAFANESLPIFDANDFRSDKYGVAKYSTDLSDTIFINDCSNNADTTVDSPIYAVGGATFCLVPLNRKRKFLRSKMLSNGPSKIDIDSWQVLLRLTSLDSKRRLPLQDGFQFTGLGLPRGLNPVTARCHEGVPCKC